MTMIIYKLQYLFQRNCMLCHDYMNLLQKLNADYLYIIYSLKLYSIVILQHIKTLYMILIPFRFFLLTLNQLMKYSQRYRIKKLNTFKSEVFHVPHQFQLDSSGFKWNPLESTGIFEQI